ncbi:YcaO-like family protein [Sorangium sp. So ce136]|uniref:YcaO-like family protein n=1 Tax=Sorangium sp. So ce136 TaxID=3133284 RepID=UPI003F05A13F
MRADRGGAAPEAGAASAGGAVKGFRAGTHRLVPPEETLERARRFMPALGITRIANATGLDHVGVPVAMAFRPNSRSLSVAQGKGLTLAAAKASAVMEAIESYHAERSERPLRLARLSELRRSQRVLDVAALPRLRGSAFHDDLRTLWIEGRDLFGGAATWAPYEVVHTDYTLPLPPGSGSFVMSSNGLASGNHALEATSHAVCEIVERDAATLFALSSDEARRRARVDLSTVDDPACRSVLSSYERAGIDAGVWEVSSDVGIAAFSCTIVDREPNPHRPIAPMSGLGCHPAREIALLRALTEAAQSRITILSGSRDDIRHAKAGPEGDLREALRFRAELGAAPPARAFHDAPNHAGETFEDDLAWQLDRLRAVGVRQAVVIDLSKPEIGIPVVRVVIPGLEPLHEIPGYTPGVRARERLRAPGQ